MSSRRFFTFAGFVAAAAVIRCFDLEGQSLWNDELFSFNVANLPFVEIQSSLVAHYHHPPFFFYLLHLVLRLLGQHAWVLRLVSAVCGSLTVGFAYLCGAKLSDELGGVVGGFLCLAAPFHLAYSQEGRPYALAALFAVLSFYLLLLAVQERGIKRLSVYTLTSLVLLYTHHWGMFVVASHVVVILFSPHVSAQVRKKFIIAWFLIGILYLPEAIALLHQTSNNEPGGWFWVERPNFVEIVNLGLAFSGSYFKMASSVFDSPAALKIAGGLALMVVSLGSLRSVMRRSVGFGYLALVLCLGLTIGIPLIISFIRPEVFLWYRYPVIAFPLFCVLVGVATRRERQQWIYMSAACIMILVSLHGSVRYFSWSKSNVKDVAEYVQGAAGDSVRLVIRPKYFAPLLNYYYKGNAVELDEAYLDSPLGSILDTARSYVYISLDVPNEIRDYMDGHFAKITERRFSGEAHMGMVVGVYRQKRQQNE